MAIAVISAIVTIVFYEFLSVQLAPKAPLGVELPMPEFVYIKQVAEKVSGTITSPKNEVYDFSREIVLGTHWCFHGFRAMQKTTLLGLLFKDQLNLVYGVDYKYQVIS
jgi:hypothetical protein